MTIGAVLRRLWMVYAKVHLQLVILLALIGVAQLAGMAGPYLFGMLIDTLHAKKGFGASVTIAIFMLVLGLFSILIDYVKERIEIQNLDWGMPNTISRFSVKRFLSFSIGQHLNHNSGVSQRIVNEGNSAVRSMMQTIVYNLLPTVSHLLILVAVLFYVDVPMGILVFVGLTAFAGLIGAVNVKFFPQVKKILDMGAEQGRLSNDIFRNSALVISHAREEKTETEFAENQDRVSGFAIPAWCTYMIKWEVLAAMLEVIEFLVVFLGIYYVLNDKYTPGRLIMIWSWANSALGRVRNVGGIQRNLMNNYASVKKYFEMVDQKSDLVEAASPVKPNQWSGRIEFRNVTFSYQVRAHEEKGEIVETNGRSKPVLSDVNLVVQAGQKVAVVGKSGAGKTTLAQLLQRAFDPDQGQVFIDGHDLRELDQKTVLRAIGAVAQDVKLFDQSIRYNITYGLMNDVSDDELDRVMDMVQLKEFVRGMKDGYDTVVGENGAKLSGGQKQRLGIARALIKNPAILIFDESTNNLDADNEAYLQEAIEKASQTATTFIIAHRLSTIAGADKVIVMDEGRVVGFGGHGELYRNCPVYRNLVDRQTAKMLELTNQIGL